MTRKKLVAKVMSGLLAAALTVPPAGVAQADDGSPALQGDATAVYVATDGSDETGDGTEAAPFRTVAAARDAVRDMIAAGLEGDVEILIKGGTYYLDEAIELGQDDFDSTYKVIYRNYNEEEVRLVGGQPLTGWTDEDGDGIFEADVTGRKDFYALFEDGVRLTSAKETDWKGKTVADPSHMQAVYGGPTNWFGEVLKVKSFDGNNVTTNYAPGSMSGGLGIFRVPGSILMSRESGRLKATPFIINRQTVLRRKIVK